MYPTLVIRGTGLYELWKHGLYRNYNPRLLVDLVARILALVPPWVRLSRLCCKVCESCLAGQGARECTGAPGARGRAWEPLCSSTSSLPTWGYTVEHTVQGRWLCSGALQHAGAHASTRCSEAPRPSTVQAFSALLSRLALDAAHAPASASTFGGCWRLEQAHVRR